jgi:phosphate-selective porin OprO and OprP
MNRGRGVFAFVVIFACAAMALATTRALAGDAERAVMQEILEVLRQNKQISNKQYDELRNKVDQAADIDKAAEAKKTERIEKVEASVEEKKPSPDTFRFYWKDGPKFETADKNFKLHLGGRIQNDWAIVTPSKALQEEVGIGSFQSGTEFRRARLEIEGDIYKDFFFKFQLDFAGGDVTFKDVYMGAQNVPGVQEVRIGHYKEYFSLEEQTSSKYITFMERALPNVFSPERATGAGIHPNFFGERLTYGLGVFRGNTQETGNGFGDNQDYDLSTRVTGLPWYEDKGSQLVHLGFSYVHQFRSNEDLRYRQRPESHLASRFVDTGDFPANSIDLVNPELAAVWGPLSLQAEYIRAFVDAPELDDPAFDGWYAYLSYFVTGEHRVYKLEEAAFDKVSPKHNFHFGPDGGWGAWEVAARYSKLNLNSGDVQGGNLGDSTLGVNWYLNPNIRIMANYVYSGRTDKPGSANIYESRFQVFW